MSNRARAPHGPPQAAAEEGGVDALALVEAPGPGADFRGRAEGGPGQELGRRATPPAPSRRRRPPPLAMAESKIQGWRRSSERSLPSFSRIVFMRPIVRPVVRAMRRWACQRTIAAQGVAQQDGYQGSAAAQAGSRRCSGCRCWPCRALGAHRARSGHRRQPVALQDWGDAWMDTTGARPPWTTWPPTRRSPGQPTAPGRDLSADHAARRCGSASPFRRRPTPSAGTWRSPTRPSTASRSTRRTAPGSGLPQAAGDSLPVADWPVPHRHPLLPRGGLRGGAAQLPAAGGKSAQLQRAAALRERKLPEPPRAAHLADPGHLFRAGRAGGRAGRAQRGFPARQRLCALRAQRGR